MIIRSRAAGRRAAAAGFTLIEMLAVIMILGLMAGMVVKLFGGPLPPIIDGLVGQVAGTAAPLALISLEICAGGRWGQRVRRMRPVRSGL